ncbi:MAG: hypothetical protein FD145_389 [Candidatus Saganbacteria bacterium]|uniref:Uncharacterized protein n=1 Tax=Candidatus Saganbacteria bacterium TaxID=2575572 RepID=A0A833L1X3_UNCSA|nr:MAG: hypothetical protein FD145_389 [Candidatus Saganbacteria bacterium]
MFVDSNQKSFDTYKIGSMTYIKDTQLGPKALKAISLLAPGKFVDILEAAFAKHELTTKVDINK